jgi:MFS transporter, putative metabolite:H+ symporter
MVIATFICAVSAGLIAFIPDGSWLIFAILRFFVGVGLTAAVTPSLTMVVELTPTRCRTMATSFYVVFASAGGFLAPVVSAAVMGPYGWRRVALLGFVALAIGILVWRFTPESARWLAAKGRFAAARAEVARHLGRPLDSVPLPTIPPAAPPRGNLLDLLSQPRMFAETILIWGGSSTAGYGVYLWGPTIVALLLDVPVARAAAYFVFVSRAGVTGKIIGPLSLALIAGTSHLVSPAQTEAAVFPAFLFLAFCMALVGLSFLFLGVETHGRAMVLDHGPAR